MGPVKHREREREREMIEHEWLTVAQHRSALDPSS